MNLPGRRTWETAADLIETIERLDPWEIQPFFDLEHDGSCPCFSAQMRVGGGIFSIRGRCWRVSKNDQDLIVSGTLPESRLRDIGEAVKAQLDQQEWYSPYSVMVGGEV